MSPLLYLALVAVGGALLFAASYKAATAVFARVERAAKARTGQPTVAQVAARRAAYRRLNHKDGTR